MNKSYRTVWNEALGAWVAASEITKARGKRSRSGAVVVAAAVLVALGGASGARAQALGGGGVIGTPTSVTTGDTRIDTNGLTITGGPSVTSVGIDAGNTVITNVAEGAVNGTRISNVAPGLAGTDAVNMNQLNATNNRIEGVARNAYAGVAAAMATQMPGTYVPGKTVMRVGSAVFKGESAVGISFRRTSENNGWSVTGGVGMSRAGVAATVGAEWVFN